MTKKIKIIFASLLIIAGFFYANFENKSANTKTKTIQFASWGSKSEVDIIKPILKEFEKQNPEIKIDFVHIPQNYFQKIHLLFASNLAPDVIFINNQYLPMYADAGLLDELDNFDTKPFYQKALDAMSYKNHLYAIPRDVSNLVIYYNKNLFKKYKMHHPYKSWTMQDFLLIAEKLTKDTNKDGKTDVWGISFEDNLPLFYLPYLMSEGGGILADDLKTSIIETPQSQKGLKFYSDLRNKYHVAPTKAESASATMAQLFLQQKLAMHLSGRWLTPKYRQEAKFDWDVINFPNGEKGSIVPMDASGWAISKASKHKNEASKLIKFLSSYQNIEKVTASGLIVPSRNDVAKSMFYDEASKNITPKHQEIFIDIIKNSKPTPVSVDYASVQDDATQKFDYLFNPQK